MESDMTAGFPSMSMIPLTKQGLQLVSRMDFSEWALRADAPNVVCAIATPPPPGQRAPLLRCRRRLAKKDPKPVVMSPCLSDLISLGIFKNTLALIHAGQLHSATNEEDKLALEFGIEMSTRMHLRWARCFLRLGTYQTKNPKRASSNNRVWWYHGQRDTFAHEGQWRSCNIDRDTFSGKKSTPLVCVRDSSPVSGLVAG